MMALSRLGLFLILLASLAAAQGSSADYLRAANYSKRFANQVRGETIRPVWLGPSAVLVRQDRPAGGWRYVRIDAKRGDVEEAFDHERLAKALTKETGREFDATRLDVRVFESDKARVKFALSGKFEAFTFQRRTGKLEGLDLAAMPGALLEAGAGVRSSDGSGETRIVFRNESKTRVEVAWLDPSGQRNSYATLAPGEQHDQHTFAGHRWVVEAADGRECGAYTGTRKPGLVLVTEAALDRGLVAASRDDGEGSAPARSEFDSPSGRWRVTSRDTSVLFHGIGSSGHFVVPLENIPGRERTRRVLWSGDSKTVALLRSADAEERMVHLVESAPRDQKQPKLHSMRYRKPGDTIDALRIVLIDVEKREEVTVRDEGALANPWSLDELRFAPDGSELRLRYNRRGHEVVGYYGIDVRTGSVRTIVEERPETFVDYSQKCWLRVLEEGDELLWTSERSGFHHLYSVDAATCEIRALTGGDWVLRRLIEVDEAAGTALICGLGVYPDQDPYHEHYGRVDLQKGGVTWLTSSDGTHEIEWGPERRTLVASWSRVDQPPVHELRDGRTGELIAELGRAESSELLAAGWRAPERFVAKARDGRTDIWGVIHTPTNFDATKRYPVIESIYAGPHSHFVPKSWRVQHGVSRLVELGFVVVQIDGLGTNWRSKAFHDYCWQDIGDSGLPDRVAWIRAAAKERPWMDLERVGIFGGSAGGQSSTRALLAHGDFYKVAVSDCGCHDNRMDKIWWNEAWMGWPVGDHYARSSNVDLAHQLQGELLLIVGELDRNVDPASTMQVVDALVRADKDFDLLVIPGAGHGAAESDYGRRRRQDFFVEHLMGVGPRWK